MRRRKPIGGASRRSIVALIVGAISALFLWPWPALSRVSPFIQVFSFRPVITCVALVLALALWALSRFRSGAALAVVVVGLVGAAALVPRAIPPIDQPTWAGPTVLSLNVNNGHADLDELVRLITSRRPEIVVLPEAGDRFRDQLMTRLQPLGYQAWTAGPRGLADVSTETVIAASSLGPGFAQERDAALYPWITVRFPDSNLTVVAIHTAAPAPGQSSLWREDLARISGSCAESTQVVVAGDFNATEDHADLPRALDGCTIARPTLTGTWPAWFPPWARTHIDHVAVRPGTPGALDVLDVAGTDHRAVFLGSGE